MSGAWLVSTPDGCEVFPTRTAAVEHERQLVLGGTKHVVTWWCEDSEGPQKVSETHEIAPQSDYRSQMAPNDTGEISGPQNGEIESGEVA